MLDRSRAARLGRSWPLWRHFAAIGSTHHVPSIARPMGEPFSSGQFLFPALWLGDVMVLDNLNSTRAPKSRARSGTQAPVCCSRRPTARGSIRSSRSSPFSRRCRATKASVPFSPSGIGLSLYSKASGLQSATPISATRGMLHGDQFMVINRITLERRPRPPTFQQRVLLSAR